MKHILPKLLARSSESRQRYQWKSGRKPGPVWIVSFVPSSWQQACLCQNSGATCLLLSELKYILFGSFPTRGSMQTGVGLLVSVFSDPSPCCMNSAHSSWEETAGLCSVQPGTLRRCILSPARNCDLLPFLLPGDLLLWLKAKNLEKQKPTGLAVSVLAVLSLGAWHC